MKQNKRNPSIFSASNVSLDISSPLATSYDWWVFLKKINGLVVFNAHKYSITTCRHQSKVLSILASQGVKIDLWCDIHESLGDTMPPVVYRSKAALDAVRDEEKRQQKKADRAAKKNMTLKPF